MSDTATLSDAVEAIEQQAERKETAENIDQKVAAASRTASNLNGDVQELSEKVEVLQFYRQVFAEIVEPAEIIEAAEHPKVQSALEEAEDAVQPTQDEIVEALVDNTEGGPGSPVNELRKDVTAATASVENATEGIQKHLREFQNEWEERLTSARDLQEIISGQNEEFINTVNWMEKLVTEEIWKPESSVSMLISDWEGAIKRWEAHRELQGLEEFQQTHDLSDDAIDAVEKLSSRSSLTLADVDVDVLTELKQIDQLSEAVELSI
jgi:hypothetical protein